MRTPSILAAIVSLVLLANSCAAPLAVEGQRQTETGSLVILGTAEEEYVRGMTRAFELETGIKTTYVRKSAGEALEAVRANRYNPRYSVWWGGNVDGYIAANNEGLIAPYKPKGSASIPRQYKDADGAWTGVYVGVLAFAVNTQVLQQKGLPEPASWADLARPEYRGLISLSHPTTSGTAYTMLATVVQLHNRNVGEAFQYLEALNKNVVEYEKGGATVPRVVGEGKAAIGVAFAHDIRAAAEDGYQNLKTVYPSEGTGYEIGGMAMLKNGPDPDSAKRFMDWALTPRAQEMGPLFTAYQIPTNPDAKVPSQSARLSSIKTIDYDFQWSGANRELLIQRFVDLVSSPANRTRGPS